MVIMRYIDRKFKALYPVNEEEERKCDVAQGAVWDFRIDFKLFFYLTTLLQQALVWLVQFCSVISSFQKSQQHKKTTASMKKKQSRL